MKKHTILFAAVLVFSLSNAQYLEDNTAAFEETNTTESNPVISYTSFASLPNEGRVVEHLNGKALYEAHVKNKKLNGRWQSWYGNGLLCDSGSFVRGLPDGEWKHWDADGRLMALRTFSADKYDRINNELVRYNPRRIAYPLTVLYHKDRKAALKYLRASYSFTGGSRSRENLTFSQLIAANIAPGSFYQPVFDHSLHDGLYINYFANGLAKDSGYYKNGLRSGVWVHRNEPGGAMQRGVYENGIKVKGWRTYDPHGKLIAMSYYTGKGRPGWQKTFK